MSWQRHEIAILLGICGGSDLLGAGDWPRKLPSLGTCCVSSAAIIK